MNIMKISVEIIEKSTFLADRRLEERNRRLENVSLRKNELLERLEANKERLERV